MCLSRGVFEGGCAGVLVGSPYVHQFEGVADGGLEAPQRQAWRCPVDLGSRSAGGDPAVPGMVAQWWGWPHRAGGDGRDGGDAPRRPYITASS
jgi:hypothetical protein